MTIPSSVAELLDFSPVDWEAEANAIIHDVKRHVADIQISTKLESTQNHIFMNLTTIEQRRYCVRVSGEGFRVVGYDYDQKQSDDQLDTETYETPYALLGHVSLEYTKSFGDCLSQALQILADDQK